MTIARSAGVFNGGRKLLVYVSNLVAAIFDFMTEEDWREKKHFRLLYWLLYQQRTKNSESYKS